MGSRDVLVPLTRTATALAALAVALATATLIAQPPAAAAVTSISVQDAVLVPGTGLSIQNATLNAASVDGEQFDVAMPEDIGVSVLAVLTASASDSDSCQVTAYGQRWHCQPYPGATRLMVQYQTTGLRASQYPVLEQRFPVTSTDTTTGAQATAHTTVQPSTDLSTYVAGSYPPAPGIAVEVMNHGPSESSSSTVVITVAGTYVTTSMPAGCARAAERITCHVPQLLLMGEARFVVPLGPGTGSTTFTATVTGAEHDQGSSNNSFTSGPWIIFPIMTDGHGNEISPPGPAATRTPGAIAARPTPAVTPPAGASPAVSDSDAARSPAVPRPSTTSGGRSSDPSAVPQLASSSARSGGSTLLFTAAAVSVLALLAAGYPAIRRHRRATLRKDAKSADTSTNAVQPTAD